MYTKPNALPTPPDAVIPGIPGRPIEEVEKELALLLARRNELGAQLEQLDEKIKVGLAYVCGAFDESQHVETYDGSLGVSRAFVDSCEASIGQLQWLDDLLARFSGPKDRPGNVNNERWGTGALISPNLFLTAGHCFDQTGNGWKRPVRNGAIILPDEIATLMKVNFKYQYDSTGALRPGVPFPVIELREYSSTGIDYAILELGRDANGNLPGDLFDWLPVATTDATTPGTVLCVIQHPNQQEKRIEAGTLLRNRNGLLAYNNIDTGGGSSGAPVLTENGEIVGVHIKGGCKPKGGANRAQAIGVIRHVSALL